MSLLNVLNVSYADMWKDGLHDNAFSADSVSALREMLRDPNWTVRSQSMQFFIAAASNGVWCHS